MSHGAVLCGDALDILSTLDDESVQMCVTSPPYWGLRDYKHPGQLGLEQNPQDYIQKLVAVFAEARRVLRKDGTLWLNIGDSYSRQGGKEPAQTKWQVSGANDGQGSGNARHLKSESLGSFDGGVGRADRAPIRNGYNGVNPKNLVGIPWMLAFALRNDGWYLRQDIIWAKRNAMPESVTDRCTKSHEYLFLLSKSERYYFDSFAIAEPLTRPDEAKRKTKGKFGGADKFAQTQSMSRLHSGNEYTGTPTGTRNKRDVWWISSQPYKGAHFACFPPTLVEPCVLAGTSEKGCCPNCGSPWKRIVGKIKGDPDSYNGSRFDRGKSLESKSILSDVGEVDRTSKSYTVGWSPTCKCGIDSMIPRTVLDPFGGSGTVGQVCRTLNRDWILIDLNEEYCQMAGQRIHTNYKSNSAPDPFDLEDMASASSELDLPPAP